MFAAPTQPGAVSGQPLGRNSEEVAFEEFSVAGLLPASAEHGFGEHRVVSDVAHIAGEGGASVEPIVDRVLQLFGEVGATNEYPGRGGGGLVVGDSSTLCGFEGVFTRKAVGQGVTFRCAPCS